MAKLCFYMVYFVVKYHQIKFDDPCAKRFSLWKNKLVKAQKRQNFMIELF